MKGWSGHQMLREGRKLPLEMGRRGEGGGGGRLPAGVAGEGRVGEPLVEGCCTFVPPKRVRFAIQRQFYNSYKFRKGKVGDGFTGEGRGLTSRKRQGRDTEEGRGGTYRRRQGEGIACP